MAENGAVFLQPRVHPGDKTNAVVGPGITGSVEHQTVFGDAAAGGGRREAKSACVVAGVGGRAGIGVAVHRNSARKPLSSDRGGSAVLLSKFG